MFKTNWRRGDVLTADWANSVGRLCNQLSNIRGAGGVTVRRSAGSISVANISDVRLPFCAKITDHGGTVGNPNTVNKYSFTSLLPYTTGGTPLQDGNLTGAYTSETGWAYELTGCTDVLVGAVVTLMQDTQGNYGFVYAPQGLGAVPLASWGSLAGTFDWGNKTNYVYSIVGSGALQEKVRVDIVLMTGNVDTKSKWQLSVAECPSGN